MGDSWFSKINHNNIETYLHNSQAIKGPILSSTFSTHKRTRPDQDIDKTGMREQQKWRHHAISEQEIDKACTGEQKKWQQHTTDPLDRSLPI